mmetsp:Transcript_47437/g.94679  ORF Transcript_47437/g.94679 Transcript_47437/m.94679 type:complete len:232 (-) Transcript_47437:383-1078(-)
MFAGKVVKGRRLKRPPEGFGDSTFGRQFFEVVMPASWVPGFTHFQAQVGDFIAAIPVPNGAGPKTLLHVAAPQKASKGNIVIPADAVPGSQFLATVGGQTFNVPVPPYMKPGQKLSVTLPAADATLEVRIAKPGETAQQDTFAVSGLTNSADGVPSSPESTTLTTRQRWMSAPDLSDLDLSTLGEVLGTRKQVLAIIKLQLAWRRKLRAIRNQHGKHTDRVQTSLATHPRP